jgi:pseudaminic acid synthase
MKSIQIGDRLIGPGHPTFIIAELSANHLHDYNLAIRTIDEAHKAGADAIKLQTYTADTITIKCDKEHFKINQGTLWDGKSLYELYEEAYTPWDWQPKLKTYAESKGLLCFSSPFDPTAVDFLEEMDVPAYKIASFEITDIPLIEYVAARCKPVIISTGIATLEEIQDAVNACKSSGNEKIILLKCTSAYPTPLEDVNLLTIQLLEEKFKTLIGLSDHTIGVSVPIASVSLGACVVEKHLIVDRSLGGPDSAFSLEPSEFKNMVDTIREVELALGTKEYTVTEKMKIGRVFSRSLFAIEDISKGSNFTHKNVRSIRPGYGLPPKFLKDIIGKKATQNITRGTPLSWNLIE